jgi:hypothetical protein
MRSMANCLNHSGSRLSQLGGFSSIDCIFIPLFPESEIIEDD